MKKIFTIALACALACTAASAQSGLSSLLGKISGSSNTSSTTSQTANEQSGSAVTGILNSLLNTVVGATANVTLAGNTYTYNGSAITLKSDDTVAALASSTVSSTIEGKIDAALAKVGIKAGTLTLAFATDGTFTCTVKNIPITGTYTQAEKGKVTLNFGKTMKFYTIEGAVVANTEGVQIVFEGDKYLTMVKNILTAIDQKSTSATTSTINTLLSSYNGLSIGFKLKK